MGRRIPPRAAPVPILLLATALAWLPTAGSAVAGVACGGFHQVPTPNPGTLADTLESVSAASPHAALNGADAWPAPDGGDEAVLMPLRALPSR